MIKQDELDEMKEDAERGHGIDCEKTLDLILDINRLTRLMPHTCETCAWVYRTRCTHEKYVSGSLQITTYCPIREWKLKE